jgi:hypothetical protein
MKHSGGPHHAEETIATLPEAIKLLDLAHVEENPDGGVVPQRRVFQLGKAAAL